MTESPRRDGPEPTQPPSHPHSGYSDPAYASQTPYGSAYQPPPAQDTTRQLPPYDPYAYQAPPTDQFGAPPTTPGEPDRPGPALWLWALAALSVVIVVGLVIALVVVNGSQSQTVVAPPDAPPEPSFGTSTPSTTRTPSTTSPIPIPVPPPATTPAPGETATPGPTETVVYDVQGDGRAINITYIDSGGVFQTEFNVMLPWSKEVRLSAPARQSASVSIINVGREITCAISVDGAQVQQRTGSGLTICSPV